MVSASGRFALVVEGRPVALRPAARRTVAACLARGVAPIRADPLEVAVHEVLANALEHGHHGASVPGIAVTVRACGPPPDGFVEIRVTDAACGGVWVVGHAAAAAPPLATSGRGLDLVHAAVDDLAVTSREGATTVLLRVELETSSGPGAGT